MSTNVLKPYKGTHCPHCGGADIESNPVQCDSGIAWAEVECENCGSTWADQYALIGYTNLKISESFINKGEYLDH